MTIDILLSLYYPPSLPLPLSFLCSAQLSFLSSLSPIWLVCPILFTYLFLHLFTLWKGVCSWSACERQRKTCWSQASPSIQGSNWAWQAWKQMPAFTWWTIWRALVCLLNPHFHSAPLLWVYLMKVKYPQSRRTIQSSLVRSHHVQGEDINTCV